MLTMKERPVVKAEMLIRKPVQQVFEAFIDPEVTTKFWFTKSSGRLEAGSKVRWDWEMYGVHDEILVKAIEPNRSIHVDFSDGTTAEWSFRSIGEIGTHVTITSQGFSGDGDSIVSQAIDSMGGYTIVLCGLKAFLEHQVQLNLVADKAMPSL